MANMNEQLERIIGALQQSRKDTNQALGLIRQELKEIQRDIGELQKFRWQFLGGCVVISVLVGTAFEVLH
jgi:hypothetical protein